VAGGIEVLDASSLPSYLHGRGVAPDGSDILVTPLSGGISNVVLRADWSGGAVVVKQSLPRLRVEAEWEFDRARILVERACMDVLAARLPGSTPTVVFSDDRRFVLGMSCLPAGGVVWKDAHMAGELNPGRTSAAAELLGGLQRSTAGDSELAARFDDLMPLEQGRIDPYHRTAAVAHPDLAGRIELEVRRLLATRSVLVHGDFSPKNLVAYDGRMMMLDFEVAHWGDPAFDVAFLLSHLVLGSCHHEHLADGFVDEAVRFWRTYRSSARAVAAEDAAVVVELACLLLARIDGKSPVEYLTDERKRGAVRRYARALLVDDGCRQVEPALARARGILRDAPSA
jgi:5-methylthioribose kinase